TPVVFKKLMAAFWPGPLTVVFPARSSVPRLLTGGIGTVGIRQTPDPLATRLLHEFAGPITATSANRSGGTPATTAAEVQTIFGSEVDLVLDGGTTPGGAGSTLVGCDEEQRLCCLRAGRIPFVDILKIVADND
ncbi:MAG: Sua5/YciO/YrdC/YwlC family protein, partial [Candidatus Electrothrix sp. AR4]|nr:Sua5/YciO/YrdC/YwlC family protein [Candidatus Electrothrix sp. AR4]